MSWRPLLNDDLKDRALQCVTAIADDLTPFAREMASDPSLASGNAGLAMLYCYLAQAGRGLSADAERHLECATTAVAEQPTSASLFGGLTGVGWTLAHVQKRLSQLDGADDLAEIDSALLDHVSQSPGRGDYDLISGLVGFGVYALERLPGASARTCLERIVDCLAESAEERADGVTWWTNPRWLQPPQRDEYPRGYYNLGLSHGVPGAIALLGQICRAGIAETKARALLAGAVRWLLAQQTPGGFPAWIAPDESVRPARLAWCYGDPGVAAALLWAARSANEPAWEREALAIARRASERPTDQAGVVDAGLCHGAVGLGHIFNRMFQATSDPWLADTARGWFERTLQMRRPGRGVGGFEAWHPGNGSPINWVAEPGFLTGAAGIALALLAATTTDEPAWDRVLLTAIPPTSTGDRSRA